MSKTELELQVDELEARVNDLRSERTRQMGFEAGLLGTRGSMDSEPSGPQDHFLIGYQHGINTRMKIVGEAVATLEPKYNSTLQLHNLVEESEALLSAIDTGHFNTDAMSTQVARARVHLADTKPDADPDEYTPPFVAEDRMLAYFGTLHRAAKAYLETVSENFQPNKYDDLNAALALPPDIEAAVEGPRGRHV